MGETTRVWILGAVVCLTNVLGCSGCRNGKTMDRLQDTIRELEEHGSEADAATLAALRQATRQSLETPELVLVNVYQTQTKATLWVEWIEKYPTPDAILIKSPVTGWERSIRFNQMYLDENLWLADTQVLYRFVYGFDPGADEWKVFGSQIASGQAVAVLTKGGKEVSNSIPVILKKY